MATVDRQCGPWECLEARRIEGNVGDLLVIGSGGTKLWYDVAQYIPKL